MALTIYAALSSSSRNSTKSPNSFFFPRAIRRRRRQAARFSPSFASPAPPRCPGHGARQLCTPATTPACHRNRHGRRGRLRRIRRLQRLPELSDLICVLLVSLLVVCPSQRWIPQTASPFFSRQYYGRRAPHRRRGSRPPRGPWPALVDARGHEEHFGASPVPIRGRERHSGEAPP